MNLEKNMRNIFGHAICAAAVNVQRAAVVLIYSLTYSA